MLGYSIAEAPIGGTSSAALTETPTPQPDPTSDAPRFARLFSDISKGAWQPSTGNDLYAMVNEVTPDPANYMQATGSTPADLALGPVADPGASTNQVVRYEAHASQGGKLKVTLKQGTTEIASRTHNTLPTVWTIHELRLTSQQCDAITNYRDLRLEFTAN